MLWFVPIPHLAHGQNCLFTTRKGSGLKNSSHLIKRLFTDHLHKSFKPKHNEGEGCLLCLQQHQSLVVSPHYICFPSKAAHAAPAPRARHFLEDTLPPTAPGFQSKLSPSRSKANAQNTHIKTLAHAASFVLSMNQPEKLKTLDCCLLHLGTKEGANLPACSLRTRKH